VLSWGSRYSLQLLKRDLVAGLTVGVVLVPQGLAYATLAELPPVYGLYASLVPLPLYALLGSSRHISVGPFALVSILVAETVSTAVHCGEKNRMFCEDYVDAVLLLSLMVGLLHLLMAALRLDVVVVAFLSEPVLNGFTSASAILIAGSQMKHFLGLPIPRGTLLSKIAFAVQHYRDINPLALATGLGGILMLRAVKDLNTRLCPSVALPEQLLLLVTAICTCLFLFDDGGDDPTAAPPPLHLVGAIPSGLPSPHVPRFLDADLVARLIRPALVVGLFAYILSMSIVRTMALRFEYRTDANQELFAFGVANVVGSFFSSYPAAGSLSRSALVSTIVGGNDCTPLHGVFTSSLVLVALIWLTPAFRFLPYAVLASIIFMSVNTLFDFRTPRRLLQLNYVDFLLWLVAFVATLLCGVQIGIELSVACSLVTLIASSMRPPHALLGRLPGTSVYVATRNSRSSRSESARQVEGVAIFGFHAALHFANKDYYHDALIAAIDLRSAERSSGIGTRRMPAIAAAATPPYAPLPPRAEEPSGDQLSGVPGQSDTGSEEQRHVGADVEAVRAGGEGTPPTDQKMRYSPAQLSDVSPQTALQTALAQQRHAASENQLDGMIGDTGSSATDPSDVQSRSEGDEDSASDGECAGTNGHGSAHEPFEGEVVGVYVVVLDFAGIPSIDASALRMLEELCKELAFREVRLIVCGCDGHARQMLERAGFFERVGVENVYPRVDAAAKAAREYVSSLHRSLPPGTPPPSPYKPRGVRRERQGREPTVLSHGSFIRRSLGAAGSTEALV
jgi:SulP family sulfate permease